MNPAFSLPTPAELGKVAVLMGGASSEREVSLMSGQGVLEALHSRGVDAHAIDPSRDDWSRLKAEGFNRAFLALHGRFGEDGTIQGALELMGLPYTGSGVMTSSLALDKLMTKRIWQAAGLPTPEWAQVSSVAETEAAFERIGAPMIVKPSREGSTLGLSKVTRLEDCAAAYALAAERDALVLCERCVVGDEVTQAVLGRGATAQVLPLIRVAAPDGNYDYHNKYFGNDTQYLIPSGLDTAEEQAIGALVLQAYQALGARGWGRIDVMIDARTRSPYLLELNTSPGMTGHSLVPMAAAQVGLAYPDLCLWLLAQARLDYDRTDA